MFFVSAYLHYVVRFLHFLCLVLSLCLLPVMLQCVDIWGGYYAVACRKTFVWGGEGVATVIYRQATKSPRTTDKR